MSEAVPQFFLSYSQADGNRYLYQFFDDLRKRVADRSGLAIDRRDADADEMLNKVGFRDRYGVKTGQDWKEKIGAAMQYNGVLVCLYSPNFFSHRQTKQFCAREFTAFLKRHPDLKDGPGTDPIPKTRHILPILWMSLQLLRKQGLPPDVLRLISWALDSTAGEKLNDRYLKDGMLRITMGQGLAYEDILDYFADRIIEIARDPLPPLSTLPDIEMLPGAWIRREDKDINSASSSSKPQAANPSGASTTSGPTLIRVIEVRESISANEWTPYSADSMLACFEQIINRRILGNRTPLALHWQTLDPTARNFTAQISSVLRATTENSERPILVVDPKSFANDGARAALVALLNTPWRAGFLVPAHGEDKNAVRLIEQFRSQLTPATQGWQFRIVVGDQTELRTAATSVAQDLLFSIVTTDEPRQSPVGNRGPRKRPRIANQQEPRV